MELTAEQKEAVGKWVAEGASIADVQKRLNEEFQVALTFMEARFLIDDLDLELEDKAKTPGVSTPLDGDAQAPANPPAAAKPAADGVYDLEPEPTGSVSVDVDKITRPGAVVSGNVVFSDGVKATWALDQMGRLALDPGSTGYQPSPEDIEAFQKELSAQLQKQGF